MSSFGTNLPINSPNFPPKGLLVPSISEFPVSLFYSYSHQDSHHRRRMEKALALLRKKSVISEWYDGHIAPGQRIPQQTRMNLLRANIAVFMFSPDFIASNACMEEWHLAAERAKNDSSFVRIPLILSECAWKDVDEAADLKALPDDAVPIDKFVNANEGWQQVYEGIRAVAERIRQTFNLKEEIRTELEDSQFTSQERLRLQNIFVFPLLSCYRENNSDDTLEDVIESLPSLLKLKKVLVHGEQLSGKTALCRHIFLSLVDQSRPALYLDLSEMGSKPSESTFRSKFESQFTGDFVLWQEQQGKTAILDNLDNSPKSIDHVLLAVDSFESVIVACSSDTYYAYFKDEEQLADFAVVQIRPMSHSRQEQLIRKRTTLLNHDETLTDGKIDAIENRVNSVIISSKILPRYPFFVLSILQTYEGFMPRDLSVTSFSHCYYALILAQLIRSGVQKTDEALNMCFNFLEELAWAKFDQGARGQVGESEFDFAQFLDEYQRRYILKIGLLNRMKSDEHGLLTKNGEFRSRYMYFYFLGKYLAENAKQHESVIEEIIVKNYLWENAVTLMFLIHHTNDDAIIEDIVIRSMMSLEGVQPATLNRQEASTLDDVVRAIPESVLSEASVQSERKKERESRDRNESIEGEEEDLHYGDAHEEVNDIYRILKNNEILGQVLKNRHGRLERKRIREIVEAITEGGLKVVGLFLSDEELIDSTAEFIHGRQPHADIDRLRILVRRLLFVWTMENLEQVVSSLNTPAIRAVVDGVVQDKDLPAYDLIGFFLRLDAAENFGQVDKTVLSQLLEKHDFNFFKKVLSIRTQWYLNTHHVPGPVEQSVCSVLGVKYRARLKHVA